MNWPAFFQAWAFVIGAPTLFGVVGMFWDDAQDRWKLYLIIVGIGIFLTGICASLAVGLK